MKSLIIICAVGFLSFANINGSSPNVFFSVILPIVVLLSVISLALWVVIFLYNIGHNQSGGTGGDSGGSGGFDGGGGDGGY